MRDAEGPGAPGPSACSAGGVDVSEEEERVYFTDRGIEELSERRGSEEVTLEWVAERLREFVDLNPEFETPIDRLATWLARLDEE